MVTWREIKGLGAGVRGWLTQVPTATPLAPIVISSARAWAGVFHPRVFRGRLEWGLGLARWVVGRAERAATSQAQGVG